MSGAISPDHWNWGYYFLVGILILSCPCIKSQAQLPCQEDYKILKGPNNQSIDEGNWDGTFMCESCGEVFWIVTNSLNEEVNKTVRGISSTSRLTDRNTQLSVLSVRASRNNDGLLVTCVISRNSQIRSETVQLDILIQQTNTTITSFPIETADSPTIPTSTATGYDTTSYNNDGDDGPGNSVAVGPVVAGVIFVIAVSVLLIGLVLGCKYRFCQKQNSDESDGAAATAKKKRPTSISIGLNSLAKPKETTTGMKSEELVTMRSRHSQRLERHVDVSRVSGTHPLVQDSDLNVSVIQEHVQVFDSESNTNALRLNTSLSSPQETGEIANDKGGCIAVTPQDVFYLPGPSKLTANRTYTVLLEDDVLKDGTG